MAALDGVATSYAIQKERKYIHTEPRSIAEKNGPLPLGGRGLGEGAGKQSCAANIPARCICNWV